MFSSVLARSLHSRRWTITVLGLLVLLAMQLAHAPAEVLAHLALGVGGAIAVFVGGESWADKERAKSSTPQAATNDATAHDAPDANDNLRNVLAGAIPMVLSHIIGSTRPGRLDQAPPAHRHFEVTVDAGAEADELLFGDDAAEPGSDELRGWLIVEGSTPPGTRLETRGDQIRLVGTPTEVGRWNLEICLRTAPRGSETNVAATTLRHDHFLILSLPQAPKAVA